MKWTILVATLLWISFGVYAAGSNNAYSRGAYCDIYRNADWAAVEGGGSYVFLLFGPFGAAVEMFLSGFNHYGWTLSRQPTEHCR